MAINFRDLDVLLNNLKSIIPKTFREKFWQANKIWFTVLDVLSTFVLCCPTLKYMSIMSIVKYLFVCVIPRVLVSGTWIQAESVRPGTRGYLMHRV